MEQRKEWLSSGDSHGAEVMPDFRAPQVSVGDFVDRELIQYSRADIVRSIPSVVDGLKPSQRKVLYACFRRRLRQEMKVAQLAG